MTEAEFQRIQAMHASGEIDGFKFEMLKRMYSAQKDIVPLEDNLTKVRESQETEQVEKPQEKDQDDEEATSEARIQLVEVLQKVHAAKMNTMLSKPNATEVTAVHIDRKTEVEATPESLTLLGHHVTADDLRFFKKHWPQF